MRGLKHNKFEVRLWDGVWAPFSSLPQAERWISIKLKEKRYVDTVAIVTVRYYTEVV